MDNETECVERGPCEGCGEAISMQANKCPHCDHNPAQQAYYAPLLLIMLGGVLTIFIITAIVGIPMVLAGLVWAVWVWCSSTPSPTDISG